MTTNFSLGTCPTIEFTGELLPLAMDLPCTRARYNSAVNFCKCGDVTSNDNQRDNSAVNFCPSNVTNRYRTIQRWIFSVRKLIFWQASSKITLGFPSPKTNLLSKLPKTYFFETISAVNFDFRCLSRVRSAILQMTQSLLWHVLVFIVTLVMLKHAQWST